ncbi:MAG: M14 family metallopeptidase [Candidatus Competibacteraceae bacterium]
MTTSALLTMTTPLGDSLTISYHDIGPADHPPRLALVAGLHGNELNGVFVLSRLADFLGRIQTGERRAQVLRERVVLIPAVNVLGVNTRSRTWPFDKIDLNRSFPGDSGGETTQRIAAAVVKLTRPAYYRVDIHSSNTDIEEVPQVRLYEPNDDERASACLFGLPAVIERPVNPIFTTNLVHTWRQYGGENFAIQCGRAGNLQTAHCESLFRALVAFLDRAGIVEGIELPEDEEHLHYFGLNQSVALMAEQSGFFVSRLEVGRWIQAGDLIGHIYDGFSGEIRAEVRAPASGLVGSLRRQPLLFEGDLMARILTLTDAGNHLERMLHSQGQ